jgi:hypothetical protein
MLRGQLGDGDFLINCLRWNNPLASLTGNFGDYVVVAVVVKHGETGLLCCSRQSRDRKFSVHADFEMPAFAALVERDESDPLLSLPIQRQTDRFGHYPIRARYDRRNPPRDP